MIRIKRNHLILLFLCFTVILGTGACKSKQKIAEQQAIQIKAENAKKAKTILTSILNDDGKMTLAQKERLYQQAKSIGSDDPEVLDLLSQVEAQLERERQSEPLENEPTKDIVADRSLSDQVSELFDSIGNSGSSGNANGLINSGMGLFSSPETTVLIIINESGGIKDYDEPTNIIKYLNYLKDQKSNPNEVYNLVLDNAGKIKEVELIKR